MSYFKVKIETKKGTLEVVTQKIRVESGEAIFDFIKYENEDSLMIQKANKNYSVLHVVPQAANSIKVK